jgi:hypothetical protein
MDESMFGWRNKEEVAVFFIQTNGPDDAPAIARYSPVITRLDYYHDPLIPFRQVLITAKGHLTLIASVRSGPDLSERLYPREDKS